MWREDLGHPHTGNKRTYSMLREDLKGDRSLAGALKAISCFRDHLQEH